MTSTVTGGRFWAKVADPDAKGCWLWQGSTSDGYGLFAVGGKTNLAHRYSYAHLIGPIPEGLTLDHLCRVRACVNPAHLEPVTRGENVLRGTGCVAQNARKTHCLNGHPLDGENLLRHEIKRGHRRCRICRCADQRLYKQRKKLREASPQ